MDTPDDAILQSVEALDPEDILNQTDFSDTGYTNPFLKYETPEPSEDFFSTIGDEGLGAGEPGLDNSFEFFTTPEPEERPTFGNDWFPSNLSGYDNMDGTSNLPGYETMGGMDNILPLDVSWQPQDQQVYMTPDTSFNLGPWEQSGLTQDMLPPRAFSDTITAQRSLPLSVDIIKAESCDADGSYESDISLPISNPPSALSPVKRPTTQHQVNGEPAHTLKRRGSTDLVQGKIKRITRRNKGGPDDARLISEQYYGNPPPPREAWGPMQKDGKPLFSYNRQGELARGRPFKLKEMKWYLFAKSPAGCKNWVERTTEPGEVRRLEKVRSGLTLWIGWTPAQSTDRYPNMNSNKCKFLDCAISSRTIKTGDPRVIFDERHNHNGQAIDPFYNAGYCHLYCLEKHFDILQLFDALDVRFDDRGFVREEFNLSALKPDEQNACLRWVGKFWEEYMHWRRTEYEPARQERDRVRSTSTKPLYPGALPPAAPERLRLWGDSLTHTLMRESLQLESQAKINQRKKRREVKPDSCDRDTHRGDLDFANQAREKKHNKREKRPRSAVPERGHSITSLGHTSTKRRRGDEMELDDSHPIIKRQRSAPPEMLHQNNGMADFNEYSTQIQDPNMGMMFEASATMMPYNHSAEGHVGQYADGMGVPDVYPSSEMAAEVIGIKQEEDGGFLKRGGFGGCICHRKPRLL
ncbi:hypothetical protein PG995_002061 [Apiospora arundinis]